MDELMPGCSSAKKMHKWYLRLPSDLCYLGTTFGHPCSTFGHPWCPFSDLVPTLGRGSGALGPLVGESLEKGTQNEGNGDPK